MAYCQCRNEGSKSPLWCKTFRGTFLRNIIAMFGNSTECLLFVFNYPIAIIKYSTASTGASFSIVDSHSRNSRGITDSPFGFSVLLQFVIWFR